MIAYLLTNRGTELGLAWAIHEKKHTSQQTILLAGPEDGELKIDCCGCAEDSTVDTPSTSATAAATQEAHSLAALLWSTSEQVSKHMGAP